MKLVKNKKDLEVLLEDILDFSRPKIKLEQYITDSHVVAEITWFSYLRGEIEYKRVGDFGCGTGRFAIASAILGALHVMCIDVDIDAIKDAKINVNNLQVESRVDLLVCDIRLLPFKENFKFDTIFQNPPFGIQSRRGTDMEFLRKSIEYGKVVYTIHKQETQNYVIEKVRNFGRNVSILMYTTIKIPLKYPHHYKKIHRVNVVVLRIY